MFTGRLVLLLSSCQRNTTTQQHNNMKPFIYTSTATFSIKKIFASNDEAVAWGKEYFAYFNVPFRLFTQSSDWKWLEITSR